MVIKYTHAKGGGQFIDAETGALVSPRTVADAYNKAIGALEKAECVLLCVARFIELGDLNNASRADFDGAFSSIRAARIYNNAPDYSGQHGSPAVLRNALKRIYMIAQELCEFKDEPSMVRRRGDMIERIVNESLAAKLTDDEKLMIRLMIYAVEDYVEAWATPQYKRDVRLACDRIGIQYCPFGREMLIQIEEKGGATWLK